MYLKNFKKKIFSFFNLFENLTVLTNLSVFVFSIDYPYTKFAVFIHA